MHLTFPQDFYSLAVLALTNVELAINLSISIHLFKHDQSMKGLLPNAVVKRRFRRNAVSFVGKGTYSFSYGQTALLELLLYKAGRFLIECFS